MEIQTLPNQALLHMQVFRQVFPVSSSADSVARSACAAHLPGLATPAARRVSAWHATWGFGSRALSRVALVPRTGVALATL